MQTFIEHVITLDLSCIDQDVIGTLDNLNVLTNRKGLLENVPQPKDHLTEQPNIQTTDRIEGNCSHGVPVVGCEDVAGFQRSMFLAEFASQGKPWLRTFVA